MSLYIGMISSLYPIMSLSEDPEFIHITVRLLSDPPWKYQVIINFILFSVFVRGRRPNNNQ